MKITKEMIKKASEAYADMRHPERWDGKPWGEAGRKNHNAAIKNALEAIFKDYKLVKKDLSETALGPDTDLTVLLAEENPKESIKTCMATSSKDWSLYERDAWIWGIVFGWDDESLVDLSKRHKWRNVDVDRLKRLHQKWRA
ncbi:MAG: hypothetical protein Q8M20_18030 [Rhodocyclaceae bacterium]|nr:hypothetical protein [Rhodocyclaceae bacterium]